MDVNEVIKEFREADERYCLGDEYLEKVGSPTRENLPVAGEYAYGVTYLRDDAVEVLIARIEELEKRLKEKKGR